MRSFLCLSAPLCLNKFCVTFAKIQLPMVVFSTSKNSSLLILTQEFPLESNLYAFAPTESSRKSIKYRLWVFLIKRTLEDWKMSTLFIIYYLAASVPNMSKVRILDRCRQRTLRRLLVVKSDSPPLVTYVCLVFECKPVIIYVAS